MLHEKIELYTYVIFRILFVTVIGIKLRGGGAPEISSYQLKAFSCICWFFLEALCQIIYFIMRAS